jgi:cystathionine beta-synthase
VNFDVIDDFVVVDDETSFQFTRKLAQEEGFMVGGSSGLAAAGVYKYAQIHDNSDIFAVILFPDTGERYLGKIFSDSWLRANGFLSPPTSISDILDAKPANLPPVILLRSRDPLVFALEKIRKFRINQIVVLDEKDQTFVLLKSELYQKLLQGKDKDEFIETLNLHPLNSINLNASLTELVFEVIKYGIVLVEEDGNWVGVITRQDIIDNMRIEDLTSLNPED